MDIGLLQNRPFSEIIDRFRPVYNQHWALSSLNIRRQTKGLTTEALHHSSIHYNGPKPILNYFLSSWHMRLQRQRPFNRSKLHPFRVVTRSNFHNQFQLVLRELPTIAAAAGDQDVRRRGLPWAWAEGVQTVEGVLAAVAWWGKRVTALRVPAVDVTTVPDAALGALCLLCFLDIQKCRISSLWITCEHLRSTFSSPHFLPPLHLSDPSLCVCPCNVSVQLMDGGGKAFPVYSKTSWTVSYATTKHLSNSALCFHLSCTETGFFHLFVCSVTWYIIIRVSNQL